MLNRGPHIAAPVASLDDILRRMSGHQDKKVALFRRLRSWSPHTEVVDHPTEVM
jgi:pyruvate kinase